MPKIAVKCGYRVKPQSSYCIILAVGMLTLAWVGLTICSNPERQWSGGHRWPPVGSGSNAPWWGSGVKALWWGPGATPLGGGQGSKPLGGGQGLKPGSKPLKLTNL